MEDLRPRFSHWYREDHGVQFCRFWYQDRVCDAYLENWTAEELVARIQDEHPKARADLKVWKKGAQVIGSFEWDDVGLSVSNEVPDEDDYHDLWRWEVEIDAMEETFNMRVSPVHAIADALREVDNIWAAVDFVNGWPGEWRVHWWKRNAEMA